MNELLLHRQLTSYYHLYKKLDRIGGPEVDGDLFEEVLGLEDDILESFGLPLSNKNKGILWKLTQKGSLQEKYLQKTIEHLQAAAERHLFAPVVTDLEQLNKGKEQKRSAFDVLPELGYPTHDYIIFLYDTVLHFFSSEEVLAELSALKRLDCYGELATLKNNYPRTFRNTKTYKQYKPYLKFLDGYLSDEPYLYLKEMEDAPHPLSIERVCTIGEFDDVVEAQEQPDLFSAFKRIEPINFSPTYSVLSNLFVIEEIIFSEDSAVTVIGELHDCYRPITVTLGFDFDTLTAVIREYGNKGQQVLNYFNKGRQQSAIDYPVTITLKDKTGSNLELDQHYLKVYKPLSMGPNGKPEVMEEDFYIVDEVIDRARYDQQQVDYLKSSLGGYFHHMRNHYYCYLNAKRGGMSEAEARRDNGIEDNVRFEVSKMLYLLHKHGGRAEMK